MTPPAVALVGPFPPWRSGIADQDGRLLAAMRRLGLDPLVIGFRRMYPRFLYPGTADYSEERKEEKKDFLEGEEGDAVGSARDSRLGEAGALLDGLNPYSFVRAARYLSFKEVSLVIVPWWTSYFAPHVTLFLSILGAERPSAVRLLLCHNVFDHESHPLKDALTRGVLRRADRFAVQNARSAREISGERADAPVAIVPHPAEPRAVLPDRDDARGHLGLPLDAPVFLFSGLLRPYKGWDVLLDAFAALRKEVPSALLVLAGEPWGKARRLEAWAPAGVRLELRYLSEKERGLWFAAADAVVCPYRHATGSGIAADALAYGRPVIGTAVEGLADIVEDGHSGLLVPPGDTPALTRAMARFVREGLGPRLAAGAAHLRASFGPDAHARRVLALGGVAV
ncbi:MAG TPA: glycosyltransferase family 4 protein [Thermoanaerobaculia bacterium]|nr:glycosyltransferase family 4 protein [Thermoanaerobaculia bacterium]